jgi:hypothetical protein
LPTHLLSVSVLVLVIFLLMLSLIAYIFARWREREVQVVEMTDLLKKMFGRYLSTEVMNSIIEDPSALELGGRATEGYNHDDGFEGFYRLIGAPGTGTGRADA